MPAIASPAESERISDELEVFFYNVVSPDGTRLRAWTNDPDCLIDGPTVLLCNGLGTNAWTAPALLDPECGVRIVSWNHRGVGGSERPVDPDRVGIDEFVEDAIAVMDDAGIEVATVMGWSMGVNTMFELAVRHPERVNGLFAVAGVPGDTFRTMLAPFHLPHPVARALTVGVARTLRRIGRVISPISTRLPVGPTTIFLISHSGFMFPVADPTMAARAIKEFLSTPLDWYMHLGLRTSEHARVSLRSIKVPTMFVAGRWDVLAGARDMATAAARIEGATYVELNGSHFIAMEQPERVHDLLLELLEQVG
jgi:pimeloyl-ACP methyl ester carboxylesterase